MHWSHSGNSRNFGDVLGPTLFRHWGFEVEWAPPDTAEIVTVGSIISKLPNGWRGTILGTGTIRVGLTRNLRRARVLAVRGAYTRDACYLPKSTPLGDLGVLAPDLLAAPPVLAHPVGVLGHHVDRDIAGRHPGAHVIGIRDDPAKIMAELATCELVYVSSLHALIAADALGVPHVLEPHPGVIGGLWKFHDYGSSLGQRIVPGVERLSNRAAVADCQDRLRRLVSLLR
jgi:hypothetical protein